MDGPDLAADELDSLVVDDDTLPSPPSSPPPVYIVKAVNNLAAMGGESKPAAAPKPYPVQAPKPVGQWISGIYRDRLNQLLSGGQYESQNLLA